MKKIYFLLFIVAFGIQKQANAQIAYDFAATGGTFTELVGGTSPTFAACTGYTDSDEGFANNLPIGFTFNYNGATYTQFHLNSNGFISLGAAFTDGDVYWRNSVGLNNGPNNGGGANDKTSSRPLISPLWDDMDMAATTNMSYATSGTAGNRILTVQWKEIRWRYTATAPVVSFQVKLYEANGKIEFIYRSEAGAISSTPSASIGISAAAIGADNFISVNALTTAATVSKTLETNTVGTKPANGLTFIFTRGALPVTLTSFTGKKEGRNNILYWSTANELNNKGFEILRSADGKNFSSIGFEASKNNTTISAINYSFIDDRTLAGANYYQLKQIDIDGKTSLSNVVVLKAATRKLEITSVYPNPATDKLNAIINSDKEEEVTVSVTDLAGKIVSSQQITTSNGNTSVVFGLQNITKGTYFLRVTGSKNSQSLIQKFVKQ